MDGYLTIGTEIDDSGFDKDLKELYSKMDIASREQDSIVQKTDEYKQELSQIENEMSKIIQEMDQQELKIENLKLSGQEYSTSYNSAVDKMDELNKRYHSLQDEQNNLNSQIDKQNIKYDKINIQLDKYKNKVEKIKHEKQVKVLDDIKQNIGNISKSMNSTIRQVFRWTIAIFSLRSAYSAVTKIINLVSRYNQQIGTDLEYMQYAIATGFQSIVQGIVNVMYKLLIYINEMLKAWFNINLFANASTKNFKKTQKSAEATKKALAGFDTANILQDNKSSENNPTSPNSSPSIDLSKGLGKQETPKWLENIINFGKWVIDNWLEVIGLLSLIKLVIDLLTGNWVGVVIDFVIFLISQLPRLWDAIKVVWDSIVEFFKWLLKILQDISEKATEFVGDCISWIVDKVAWFFAHLGEIIGSIGNLIGECVQFIIDLIVSAVDGIFLVLGTICGWIYDNIIRPVGDFFVGLWDGFLNGASNAWEGIKSVFSTVGQFFKDTFTNAWNAVKKVFSTGGKIFDGIKDGIADAFKNIVNTLIKGINVIVATPFNAINGMLNKIRNSSFLGVAPFKGLWKENPISVPKIQYLKHGGIIDVPKTGVPLANNVVGGEAGPEAVIPLNEETLERLGKQIARFINISIDLTGKIDSRILFRLLEQIKAEQSFARNGG